MVKKPELFDTDRYRGPQPTSLEDMQFLKMMGIEVILDLEFGFDALMHGDVNQEQKWAYTCGIKYYHVPLSDITHPSKEDLDYIVKIITENPHIYVHCLHGVDRTGFSVAAYKHKVLGQSYDQVKDDLMQHGFHHDVYFFWLHALKDYCQVK